jgi:hypothetical protein
MKYVLRHVREKNTCAFGVADCFSEIRSSIKEEINRAAAPGSHTFLP